MVRRHLVFGKDPEFNAFLSEFQNESDRAAAVLAGAYLDEQVKQLLLATLVDDSRKCSDLLTNPTSPLGTFSSRISVAFALGLITEAERFDLDQIRQIRNDFAHHLHGLSFAKQSISAKCQTFKCNAEAFDRVKDLLTDYPQEPRKLFDLCAALLAYYLKRRLSSAQRYPAARPPLWPAGAG